MRVSLLNLHLHLPIKDLRILVYSYLSPLDLFLVQCAHGMTSLNRARFPLLCYAAERGYLKILQAYWDHWNGFPDWTPEDRVEVIPEEYILNKAVRSGQFQVVQWLVNVAHCPVNAITFYSAAESDIKNINMLEWLYSLRKKFFFPF